MEHSKLPWEAEGSDIFSADNDHISEINGWDLEPSEPAQTAKFIVHRVNTYDQLVEALELGIHIAETMQSKVSKKTLKAYIEDKNKLKAALKAARYETLMTEDEMNVSFAVHRVNTYDQLVGALEEIKSRKPFYITSMSLNSICPCCEKIIKDAEAALKAAREEG